jgi:SRSO17 transposase
LSTGEGTKGPRLHDWAYLELADLNAGEYNSALTGEWARGLLIRRNIADGDWAFFSTWCPKGTPMQKLVLAEGHRWAIEDFPMNSRRGSFHGSWSRLTGRHLGYPG